MAARQPQVPTDVWLDVDTAMGPVIDRPRDVDDGLTLIQALATPEVRVVGVSAVFGNAPLPEAVANTRHIVEKFAPPGTVAHAGAASGDDFLTDTDATRALIAALERQPLTILALGPVTNVATVVVRRPDLKPRIREIVLVAARRPGFDFHPVDRPDLKFPDANFEKDVPGMQALLDSGLKLVFAGYEASSDVWLTRAHLAAVAASGTRGQWIRDTSDPWLSQWERHLEAEGVQPLRHAGRGLGRAPHVVHRHPRSDPHHDGPRRPRGERTGGGARHQGVSGVRTRGERRPSPLPDGHRAVVRAMAGRAPVRVLAAALVLLTALAWPASAPAQPRAFDHTYATWDALVHQHVRWLPDGVQSRVDYDGMARDRQRLKTALDAMSAVSRADFDQWNRAQQMAFLVNAYNAFTVELILTEWPGVQSIKDLGSILRSAWRQQFFELLGARRHLDWIEHEQLRARYGDPRLHAALTCASIGCPALRPEAFTGPQLETQLDDGLRRFLSDRTRNRVRDGQLEVSMIFKWYAGDFEGGQLGWQRVADVFAHYADQLTSDPGERAALRRGALDITYLPYDWSLNAVRR